MNQTLYILVDDFSTEQKEAFFENELPYLCNVFKTVKVISLYPEKNKILNFSAENLQVLYFNYFEACNRVDVFRKNASPILKIFFKELKQTHNKLFYIKNFKSLLNQLILTFSAAKNLERFIKKDINATTLFYSYWFKQWAFALSIIKTRQPELKFVSRIHGGDYDEDQIKSVFPFRYFQLEQVNHIFPVSEFGRNYLIEKFKVSPSKIITARLGLTLQGKVSIQDPSILHLVSCSSVIPLKRVHLIAEILKHIKIPYCWTHFGDGPLFDELKTQIVSLHHTVELKGYIPNQEFINYLDSHPISFFINVSESEGIPVSMMEAIANGIPLIGTSVCGVPEIVVDETGILIAKDFDPAEVAASVEKAHILKTIYKQEFRERIVAFYNTCFSASKNASRLSELLLKI